MTKTQAKKQLKELLERVENVMADIDELRCDISSLKDEAEETLDSIEPYGDWDELTDAQEERQEWFEGLVSSLEEAESELDDAYDNCCSSAQSNLEESLEN